MKSQPTMSRTTMPQPKLPALLRPAAAALALCALNQSAGPAAAQNDVKPSQILAFKPKQADVEIDTPSREEAADCKVEVNVGDGKSGYVLTAPNGLVLRQFDDTTGDGQIDKYSYFKDGLEVYRDTDTNADQKIDSFRWFNTAGSRHGVDTDGDMTIDRWVRISAAEATREAVKAMAAGDAGAMAAVMLSADDAKRLGMSRSAAQMTVKSAKDVQSAMAGGKLGRGVTWARFDTTPPTAAVVPKEAGYAEQDLVCLANGIISVDVGGKPDFLIAGDLVQVGDAWKLTAVPVRNEKGVMVGQTLMAPPLPGGQIPPDDETPYTEEQLAAMEALNEQKVPPQDASPKELAAFNQTRVRLLRKLIDVTPEPAQAEPWWAEVIDVITTGVQGDAYPGGVEELKGLESGLTGDLGARATYRRIVAEYADRIRGVEPNKQGPVNEWFLDAVEGFVNKYPKSPDTPEALFQLGSSYELEGKVKEAKQWYTAAQRNFGDTLPGRQAAGALRRLGLAGQAYTLTGTTLDGKPLDLSRYKGRVVAVVHWASWSQANNDEVAALKRLLTSYQKNGFEVVGVNLDTDREAALRFVKENDIPWPNMATKDGFYGDHAVSLGLLTSQQIIVLDKAGVVADADAGMQELPGLIPKLLLR